MFRIIPGGEHFSEYALLRDGESVYLRSTTPADVPAVEALMQSVSPESLQLRFMGAVSYVARSVIESMCGGDPRERLGLLAIVGQGADARVIAIGNYVSLGVLGKAEVAFLVHDEYQGRGISTLMLERLAGIAAGNGFIGFEAEVLYENQAMLNVLRDSGFEVCQAYEGSSIHVQFPVEGLASLRERVELRDRIAAANSLVPLLQPRTAAVVGASRDPAAVGSMIFRAILRSNFAGTVYPVNNQAVSVNGVRAYASVSALPERADLVVVAVPAGSVLEVAGDALRSGTKGLLVVTSGFAETGPEGAALQKELLDLVRSHGARLIGPNCLGLLNTHPDVSLNASLAPTMAPRGRIGFYSHSAALGLVILDYAAERGLGFSTFVSAGNRADVSGNDVLQFWEEDPSTDVAVLYLETFGNARRFTRVARRIACRKPVLCVKSARSRAGRDAARAHIAAAVAHSDPNVDVLFHQAGVIRADTLEEMFDVAALLAHQPLPRGRRVAVVSNSGGVLTICVDACEARGLVTASPGVIDVGPFATVEAYESAVQTAMEQDEVDALIAIYACVGNCDPDVVGRGIRRGVLRAERTTGTPKPALLCLMGAQRAVRLGAEGASELESRHVFPSYRFPESAARALSRAVQYADFRAQPAGRVLWYEDVDAAAARQEVRALVSHEADEVVWLEGERATGVLRSFGVRTVTAADVVCSLGTGDATLEVRSDPSFGPLLCLLRAGRDPVVRITPLTDRDIRDVLQAAGLPADHGVEELLGRVSQMIEELPWLCGMTARIHGLVDQSGPTGALLGAGVRMGICRHDAGLL
jgi:acyl-CoA synthetase (NDP forming)/GNAT superfamily N-acetyltransferase